MAQHVHRIVRSEGDPIIINVVSPKKDALELDIEGTEGENPYFASFKHARLSAALSKNSPVTGSEWETILRSLLLNQRPDPTDTTRIALLKDLELAAQISTKPGTLTLTFRRNIEGIHQRIAELILPRDDDRELDTLAWVANSAERAEGLETEVRQLKKQALNEAQEAKQLREKLDELVKEKQRGEEELLSKFAKLLNAKKSKIRDQQRLLSGSLVDESKAAEVAKSRGNAAGLEDADTGVRSAGRSRKRKPVAPAKDPDESSDEFESMQGVQKQSPKADEDDESTADEQSNLDETTDAEDDSDSPVAAPASKAAAATGQGKKGKASEEASPTRHPASNTRSQTGAELVPPTRIELPFGKPAGKSAEQPSNAKAAPTNSEMSIDDDDNTEDETDDEL